MAGSQIHCGTGIAARTTDQISLFKRVCNHLLQRHRLDLRPGCRKGLFVQRSAHDSHGVLICIVLKGKAVPALTVTLRLRGGQQVRARAA